MWCLNELVLPRLTEYRVWFSNSQYTSCPCYTVKETAPFHSRCTESHSECLILVRYKTGSGRGTYRTEQVRVRQLSPKIPRTKGLALVINGSRCGTVVQVRKQIRDGKKPVGVQVVEESSGAQWTEPIDNVTKIGSLDCPDGE